MKTSIFTILLIFPLLLSAVEEERNLALEGLVSSTSGMNADIIIDGIRDGMYWDGPTSDNWTLELDLGEVHSIDTVKLFFWWGDSRYYKYFITTSCDRIHFTEIVDGRKNTVPPTKKGLTFTFPTMKARYIRLYIVSMRENMKGGHVREFEVYGK